MRKFKDSDGKEWTAELTGTSIGGVFHWWDVRFLGPNGEEHIGKVYYPDIAKVPEEQLLKALAEALGKAPED